MTKEELINALKDVGKRVKIIDDVNWGTDKRQNHLDADQLLLDYINDKEITRTYNKIQKWYS